MNDDKGTSSAESSTTDESTKYCPFEALNTETCRASTAIIKRIDKNGDGVIAWEEAQEFNSGTVDKEIFEDMAGDDKRLSPIETFGFILWTEVMKDANLDQKIGAEILPPGVLPADTIGADDCPTDVQNLATCKSMAAILNNMNMGDDNAISWEEAKAAIERQQDEDDDVDDNAETTAGPKAKWDFDAAESIFNDIAGEDKMLLPSEFSTFILWLEVSKNKNVDEWIASDLGVLAGCPLGTESTKLCLAVRESFKNSDENGDGMLTFSEIQNNALKDYISESNFNLMANLQKPSGVSCQTNEKCISVDDAAKWLPWEVAKAYSGAVPALDGKLAEKFRQGQALAWLNNHLTNQNQRRHLASSSAESHHNLLLLITVAIFAFNLF